MGAVTFSFSDSLVLLVPHRAMFSQAHLTYQHNLRHFLKTFDHLPDIHQQLELYADAACVLWELDLEPARHLLEACYADKPRGSEPWDPILMLRADLLSLLVGCPSYNSWIPRLRSSSVLRALAGFVDPSPSESAKTPGIGTCYDFCARLFDGPTRDLGEHGVPPSERERRQSRALQTAKTRSSKKNQRSRNVAKKLLLRLREVRSLANPEDLLHRLLDLLWAVACRRSRELGLLGDPSALIVGGDSSILPTAASGNGVRVCECGPYERCDCSRRYRDPTAEWGYDPTRNTYFFGYRFWEASVSTEGHDLPLLVRLSPANTSDHLAAMHSLESLAKYFRERQPDSRIRAVILDAGHDSVAVHEHLRDWGCRAVIPLAQPAPALHPRRPELSLSARGVPLCQAGVEMAPNGTAGAGKSMFICPVKAGKIAQCPLAPTEDPDWLCQPETKWGPTVKLNANDNPRLFPEVARNSPSYKRLYALRSGTERSNAMKKGRFRLHRCRHVRASLWQIRLTFIAILQHAKAWVSGRDAKAWVRELMARATGPPEEASAAA